MVLVVPKSSELLTIDGKLTDAASDFIKACVLPPYENKDLFVEKLKSYYEELPNKEWPNFLLGLLRLPLTDPEDTIAQRIEKQAVFDISIETVLKDYIQKYCEAQFQGLVRNYTSLKAHAESVNAFVSLLPSVTKKYAERIKNFSIAQEALKTLLNIINDKESSMVFPMGDYAFIRQHNQLLEESAPINALIEKLRHPILMSENGIERRSSERFLKKGAITPFVTHHIKWLQQILTIMAEQEQDAVAVLKNLDVLLDASLTEGPEEDSASVSSHNSDSTAETEVSVTDSSSTGSGDSVRAPLIKEKDPLPKTAFITHAGLKSFEEGLKKYVDFRTQHKGLLYYLDLFLGWALRFLHRYKKLKAAEKLQKDLGQLDSEASCAEIQDVFNRHPLVLRYASEKGEFKKQVPLEEKLVQEIFKGSSPKNAGG